MGLKAKCGLRLGPAGWSQQTQRGTTLKGVERRAPLQFSRINERFLLFPYFSVPRVPHAPRVPCTYRNSLLPVAARSRGASLPWPLAYGHKNHVELPANPSLLIRVLGWPHEYLDSDPVLERPWVQGLGKQWLPPS